MLTVWVSACVLRACQCICVCAGVIVGACVCVLVFFCIFFFFIVTLLHSVAFSFTVKRAGSDKCVCLPIISKFAGAQGHTLTWPARDRRRRQQRHTAATRTFLSASQQKQQRLLPARPLCSPISDRQVMQKECNLLDCSRVRLLSRSRSHSHSLSAHVVTTFFCFCFCFCLCRLHYLKLLFKFPHKAQFIYVYKIVYCRLQPYRIFFIDFFLLICC